ncbi:CRISPR-associated helicase/endonuclease Cas3 [Thermus amyloliquefaciens]|uniref:CRISPR-associated helicase/endonuclease Cas3 n=1 Tax=Thermus amyloliquefaciens TaxID=1449080 RepID=UPI00056EEE78|nr:CRISPR-associated helicase/endonuclease Cas3 [Thermus amyloliquefaciens]
MDPKRAALALWAKSGDPFHPFHPLLAHMLDTAAVALAVLEEEPARTRRFYAEDWELEEEKALRLTAFLAGLHDLGKASPVFQAAWPEGAERVRQAGLTWNEELIRESWVAHGVFTDLYLREVLREWGFSKEAACLLAQALGAHHGFPAAEGERASGRRHVRSEPQGWREARTYLVEALAKALGLEPLSPLPDPSPEALLRVMALASFADWIASDPTFFPYGRDPEALGYWEEALEKAREALKSLPWPKPLSKGERTFRDLFPFAPNPLQEGVSSLLDRVQEIREPTLLLVEAPMGLGKTEAALYAYHRLQERLGHRGLYVALPTQATANGLFPRVRAFLERLAAGEFLELQLQHGAALLNPEYEKLLEQSKPAQVYDARYSEKGLATAQDAEEGGVGASAWFSARKRAMLAGHGVGTLDQALLGVLRVKHHFIRLWGLMNRVVVLDEVHAYDTYTSGLLVALLRWLKALGSSVVLMTATLPSAKREELLRAWGAQVERLPSYPRVAAFAGGKLLEAKHVPQKSRQVRLQAAPVEPDSLAKTLLERLPGALGAVVNTVDRAQTLYQALGEGERLTLEGLLEALGHPASEGPWGELWKARGGKGDFVVGKRLKNGTLVFLLHARFPAEERALREMVALSLFGKGGPRPERAVLVATQVAEQSLDLDFDLLYSDLAPIDLLFQRLGRLHRHVRVRPEGHGEPLLLVGGLQGKPEFGGELRWDKVYEDYLLLSTWLSLQGRKALGMPGDLEALLEEVYGRTPVGFPEDLRERAQESYRRLQQRWEGEAKTAENLSLMDLKALLSDTEASALAADFKLDDDAEDKRTQRFLTRLGEPSVPVVPLYRVGESWALDPEGKRPVRLKGELSKEEAVALWSRAVRLSRYPIPQVLLREDPPAAWRRSGLLRGLRLLEVGRVFAHEGGGVRVELDPELGVVYGSG